MMRVLLAALAAAAFCACTGTTESVRLYDKNFEELDHAVSQLPPSPEKTRITELLGRLQQEIVSDPTHDRYGKAMERLEQLAELTAAMAPQRLQLGFATGFKDWTGDGKHDGLEIHLTPRDGNGSAVKYPGAAEVSLEIQGVFTRGRVLDRWSVRAVELANLWNESLFPAYVLRLPWNSQEPEADRATVIVEFKPIAAGSLSARADIERAAAP